MMVWTGVSDGNNKMERCVENVTVYFDVAQSAVGIGILIAGEFVPA